MIIFVISNLNYPPTQDSNYYNSTTLQIETNSLKLSRTPVTTYSRRNCLLAGRNVPGPERRGDVGERGGGPHQTQHGRGSKPEVLPKVRVRSVVMTYFRY